MSSRGAPGSHWTPARIPDQRGRTAVITGANTGIGYETAKVLAQHGATVVLACRDEGRSTDAAARIRAAGSRMRVTTLHLDLASLSSVAHAAAELRSAHPALDLLINNAGVMSRGQGRTADGLELHLGTNHIGHFAFTGLVLDRLLAAPGSRIVTVTSHVHRRADSDFHDIHSSSEQGLEAMAAYARSKLANLLFTYELQRRLAAAGVGTIALAACPGVVRTELHRDPPRWVRVVRSRHLRMLTPWLLQDADMGALPSLRAAVDPMAQGGDYYGPSGRLGFTGFPTRRDSSSRSHDLDLQRRLWEESEGLSGVTFLFPKRTSDTLLGGS